MINQKTKNKIRISNVAIQAGFPSPAADFEENSLDLNELLIKHPAATYFFRVAGDSMKNAGIFSGDLLIIDRSIEARDGHIVVASLDGELTLKRFMLQNNRVILESANPLYPSIPVSELCDFFIWGVATSAIHSL